MQQTSMCEAEISTERSLMLDSSVKTTEHYLSKFGFTKPWHYMAFYGGILLGLYFAFVIVMYFLISQGVASQPWALTFTDAMAQWIPMLSQLENVKHKADVTDLRFYYAAYWAYFVPLCFYVYCWKIPLTDTPPNRQMLNNISWKMSIFGFLFFGFCVSIALFWPVNTSSTSWRDASMASFGLGAIHHGLMVYFCLALLFGSARIAFNKILFALIK
jgi:hypothetical protein